MHSLSIAVGPTVWRLLFKTPEAAAAVTDTLTAGLAQDIDLISLADDFGQTMVVAHGSFCGLMLEDLDASKLGNLAFNLHQAHMQVDWQSTARADPKLRAAATMQGPAVINPMGPNGRFS